ncbi:unnamed protein product [Ceutorhynchus assimilis]|uniref:CHK kinase-like domain-containing protein n=1 Tax=Ceutorhynchus assimilis TaxID=467358 RepID=A0A9N9QGR6_9CUCU|nr:unnamed protein product [Ceutorhynchus assimilis]
MANVELTLDQENLVRKAAESESFNDFDILANIGTAKGDNYLGVIHSVTVTEKNDETKVLHLICKSAHIIDNFRAMVPIIKMFKRESDLYEIVGKLREYQNEKALSRPFDGVAKFYGSCLEEKRETILMKNLKKDGYKLWDRMTPMNDEHLSAVFAEYARFHALSFAFKHQNPDRFEELSKDIKTDVFMDTETEDAKEKFGHFVQYYFKNGLNTVEGNARATAELEKLREVIGQKFETLGLTKKAVITHGDCWCNNILFRYENNNNTPSKVCFIDWQLSKVGSPALDLTYFFSASGSKETYANINKYLKTYHETLSQNLQELGCNPEGILSFDDLLDEWKNTAWYGVFIGMMILKIMLTESDEVPDYEKLESDDNMTAFSYEVKRSADYKQRLCDLIEFMADYGYL